MADKPGANKAEDRDLEQQLAKERSGQAKPNPAITDVQGQERAAKRLKPETDKAGGKTVLLKTTTGKTLEVTEQRWIDEAQTLRQMGFERADLVDAAQ